MNGSSYRRMEANQLRKELVSTAVHVVTKGTGRVSEVHKHDDMKICCNGPVVTNRLKLKGMQ